ncbi:MAG: helix-turn-helix domain-containing protein [Hyphomicrobiaceae bacterium]
MSQESSMARGDPRAGVGIAIGEAARRTGVKVATIRYYESIGLLAEPSRTEAGRRLYDRAALSRLKFIRHARELGFEIEQIRRLLQLSGEPQRSCAEVDGIAKEHLAEIDSRIARLKALREEMQHMIASCSQGKVCECRILEVLSNHNYCRHDSH